MSHAFFPDPPAPAGRGRRRRAPDRETAALDRLRATLIVMPVFVLALTNPSFYLAAIMKTVALGQQAGETDARSAGRELVGSTLMGALIALAVWLGLSLWPSLWMLMLWLMAAALWAGSALFGARRTRFRPSFWSNALITVADPARPGDRGQRQRQERARRRRRCAPACSSASRSMPGRTIWLLERWRARRPPAARRYPVEGGTA